MAKSPGATSSTSKGAAKPAGAPAVKTPAAPKKPFNPLQFARDVRAEARKISWTSRQETWITSVMVFVMVLLTAVFFVIVDTLLGHGMQAILKLAA